MGDGMVLVLFWPVDDCHKPTLGVASASFAEYSSPNEPLLRPFTHTRMSASFFTQTTPAHNLEFAMPSRSPAARGLLFLVFALMALALARPAAAQTPNYSDIWYTPGEEGWGIQIAHSGTNLFATWYTYDQNNRQTFFTVANGTFNAAQTAWTGGSIFKPTGSPYNAATYDPSRFAAGASLGTVSFTFTNANNAVFTYTVGGTTRTKNITRFPFNGASTGNYPSDVTDVYYLAAQNGWGLSVAQRGSNGYFGVIYHYDTDGQPLFFTLTGLSGQLFRTASTGANFLSATFTSSTISANAVGTFTLTPTAGGMTLSYTAGGRTVTNTLTRLLTPPSTGGNTGTGSASECLNEELLRNGATYRYTFLTQGTNGRSTSRGTITAPATCQSGGSGYRVDSVTESVTQGVSVSATTRACAVREGSRLLLSDQTTDTTFVGLPLPATTVASVWTPPVITRFDLNAGESYTQTYSVRVTAAGGGSTNTETRKTTFVGIESVTVPAGTFRACRFVDETTVLGVTTRGTQWYSGVVGTSVRTSDDAGTSVTVLESATINGRNFP
jgi:hypothetical protein